MGIKASDIMTEDLAVFSPEDRVNSVLNEMDELSFDEAPIEISNHIRKYVRRQDLNDVPNTDPIAKHAITLEEDDFLGTEVPVVNPSPNSRDLINILDEREKRFVFIVGDGIEGIVTHADLNKVEAEIPLFQLISEFEKAACDLIDNEVRRDRWISNLDDNERGDVEERYQNAKEENADLRLVDCLNTRQISEIIREYDLLDRLGFNEERADEVLDEIADLRNDVMHQRPVVGKNSFSGFVEIVENLKNANQALNRES